MLSYKDLNLRHPVQVGLDFPSNIIDDMKAIDDQLYLIWHPYRVMWDDIMNEYVGQLDDPRNFINFDYGETNFGFVLTDGQGRPKECNTWHIWRFNPDHGWAHVIKLESTDPEYLNLVLKRLYTYRCFTQKYGFKEYNDLLTELKEEEQQKMLDQHEQYHTDWMKENNWLVRKAAENMMRGKFLPTNPSKEIITSFKGQTNRSKLIVPIGEKEGGIIT